MSPFQSIPLLSVHPQQQNRYIWPGSIESINPLVIKGCPDWTPHFDGIIIEAERESKLGRWRADNPVGSGGDERCRLVNSTACRVTHDQGGCTTSVLPPAADSPRHGLRKNSFRCGEMRRQPVQAKTSSGNRGPKRGKSRLLAQMDDAVRFDTRGIHPWPVARSFEKISRQHHYSQFLHNIISYLNLFYDNVIQVIDVAENSLIHQMHLVSITVLHIFMHLRNLKVQ